MVTNQKAVGPSKSNIIKSTAFVLRKRPALPKKGLQSSAIGEVTHETGIENEVEINRVRMPVILAEKDANGQNYVIDKIYNLGENGRGLNMMFSDYFDWSSIEVSKEDYYDFDCNAAMKGKAVVVDIGYKVAGTKVSAYIKSFHPAGYTGAAEVA